jgi:MOSC domain-containing protein YiiM
VLKAGKINAGDTMQLVEEKNAVSIQQVFELLYCNEYNPLVKKAVNDSFIAESCKKDLIKRWGEFL